MKEGSQNKLFLCFCQNVEKVSWHHPSVRHFSGVITQIKYEKKMYSTLEKHLNLFPFLHFVKVVMYFASYKENCNQFC